MPEAIDTRIADHCNRAWGARHGAIRLRSDDVAVAEVVMGARARHTPLNLWAARLFLSCRPGPAALADLLAVDRVHVAGARNPVLLAVGDLRAIADGASTGDRLLRRIRFLAGPSGLSFPAATQWINDTLSGDADSIMYAIGRPMEAWNRAHVE